MVGDYPPQMICLELGFIWFHADSRPDLLARLLRSHPAPKRREASAGFEELLAEKSTRS